ncbi:response regulator transcription factor [Parapusillimonas granuli]|uniref:Response regulator transcription factor n=1 Tax=Parapusillimonas granuli TaxID=380911 RepID=A0A853G228_9BURK|nr:response regulator transcription factor [Parapusillimonas granuli]MBB5214274.1 DNA-binding NarL/FixJ family response regulator [Parapusillimonas granuli]MEB2399101.1 response regulator transcription factor [Alcaligenaceae bacterium]NYT51378.1 response regulator transcription factor [Parapusillimonas granuli]
MATPKKKLLIVADDHPRIRQALEDIIRELHGYTTLYTSAQPRELLALAERRLEHTEDLMVADVSLPEGAPATPAAASGADTPLMVVSMQERGITANWFVAIDDERGAGATTSRIQAALEQRKLIMEIIQSLNSDVADQESRIQEPMSQVPSAQDLTRLGITLRQAEVLVLLADGLTNKEIARKLDVSEWTVRHHVSSILERLEVGNRGKAAIFARRLAQAGV